MALCLVSKEYEVVLEGRTLSNMSYELFWGAHQGESNATLNPLGFKSRACEHLPAKQAP